MKNKLCTPYAGVYIFEGIDNVGKTSIIQKLKVKLIDTKGCNCIDIAFPGNEPRTLGRLVYDIHHHSDTYSAAYIMPSGKSSFGYNRKHQNNLKLLESMMRTGITKKIAKSKSLSELYEFLLDYSTVGAFLAFQYAIDINYSELCDFSEMSFVVAGPGAKNGIQKCFGNLKSYSYEDVIRCVAESQNIEFEKRELKFKPLFGRNLQLIDCQNLFCETDKYARVMYPDICGINERKRIKQQYINRNLEPIEYFFPPKWGINNNICVE